MSRGWPSCVNGRAPTTASASPAEVIARRHSSASESIVAYLYLANSLVAAFSTGFTFFCASTRAFAMLAGIPRLVCRFIARSAAPISTASFVMVSTRAFHRWTPDAR